MATDSTIFADSPESPIADSEPTRDSGTLPIAAPETSGLARHNVVSLSAIRPIPATRAECLPGGSNTARPCIHSRCKWHADNVGGNPLMVARGQAAPKVDSCVLDIADRGGASLEEVGQVLGITRSRAQQIEQVAIRKLQKTGRLEMYRDHVSQPTGTPLALAIQDSERTGSLGARDWRHQMYVAPLDIASPSTTAEEYCGHVNTFYDRRLEIRAAETAAEAAEATDTATDIAAPAAEGDCHE